MPRQIDLTRLRYYVSLGFIVTGVLTVLFVTARQVGPFSDEQSQAPAVELFDKAGPEDCPPDWRFIDNTHLRYTVCAPLNLVAYDGANTVLLEAARPDDWDRLFAQEFVLVNDAWLNRDIVTDAFSSLRPISLRIDIVPPTATFDGCDLRSLAPGNAGVVSCADRLAIDGDQAMFSDQGTEHRFRALIPTQAGKSANQVFSLYLSIHSLAGDWPLQEPLFREILAHLKPY